MNPLQKTQWLAALAVVVVSAYFLGGWAASTLAAGVLFCADVVLDIWAKRSVP